MKNWVHVIDSNGNVFEYNTLIQRHEDLVNNKNNKDAA